MAYMVEATVTYVQDFVFEVEAGTLLEAEDFVDELVYGLNPDVGIIETDTCTVLEESSVVFMDSEVEGVEE